MVGKELCKVQFMKAFEDSYYNLEQKNIILDSIRVAILDDDNDKHFKKISHLIFKQQVKMDFVLDHVFQKESFL